MRHNKQIPFIQFSRFFLIFSGIIFSISIFLLVFTGIKTSIDFQGGTIINVSISSDKHDLGFLRKELSSKLQKSVSVVELQSSDIMHSLIITTEYLSDEGDLSDILKQIYNDEYTIIGIESIGPKIGNELSKNARNAVIVSLLLIGLYITIRFDLSYSIGSIIALMHDLIITLGIFIIIDYEISIAIIAALLTIVGYSLNDTIVIYDRIRENILSNPHREKKQNINESLNQTLNRTLITSITTLIVVIVLFIYGGNVLQPFAFTLIIGVILGTYSSLFIASPVMLWLDDKINIDTEKEDI
tara:strand:+ start:1063 stop:1962 length:900 start_codon:yes stop_codon:yes gene_type:complete